MPITEGRVRTSTGFRSAQHPITVVRPVYDDTGALVACQVELEAQMDDGGNQEVWLDLLPLLTVAQRTILTNILTAIANRVVRELR